MDYTIDSNSIAIKLAILVGKTVMFNSSNNEVNIVKIESITLERTIDNMHVVVTMRYSNGTGQRISDIKKFKDIIVLDSERVSSLYSVLNDFDIYDL